MQHDVLWLTLRDAEPVLDHRSARLRADVDSLWEVPDFIQGDRAIVNELGAQRAADAARLADLLTVTPRSTVRTTPFRSCCTC